MLCKSCETTSISEYLTSTAGLKIRIFWLANWALLILLISSSVFPENIEPHITSMQPVFLGFSEYIVLLNRFANLIYFTFRCNMESVWICVKNSVCDFQETVLQLLCIVFLLFVSVCRI